jgi:hypothetical protein
MFVLPRQVQEATAAFWVWLGLSQIIELARFLPIMLGTILRQARPRDDLGKAHYALPANHAGM